jgi:hypothetical protein
MTRSLWILYLLTLFCLGCGPDQPGPGKANASKSVAPPEPKSEASPPGPSNPSSSELKASIVSLPEPNRYQVQLFWNKHQSTSPEWDLSRIDPLRGVKPLGSFSRDTGGHVDSEVAGGERYRYRLTPAIGAEAPLEVMVTIPRDLVIQREMHLREIRGMRRVFLEPRGKVFTDGNYFELIAEEVIARGGTIETFPEGPTPFGKDGRSGGTIVIRAHTGSGKLPLLSRGEGGGEGMSGIPGKAGFKGNPGKDAVIGPKPGDAGPPGTLVPSLLPLMQPPELMKPYYECKSETGEGEAGTMGSPGTNGGNGGRGGDSGKIFIEILDPSAIEVMPRVSEGTGGKAGVGGAGGLGGPGGDPGKRDGYQLCREANPGPIGPSGPAGKDGLAGANGIREAICLKLGTATYGDCTDFPVGDSRVW